jgi:nitrous oxide reductase accessory protein NosL
MILALLLTGCAAQPAVVAPTPTQEAHVYVIHACGQVLLTEYDGPEGSGVTTRPEYLASPEIRAQLEAAIDAADPDDLLAVDITPMLEAFFGWVCPGST